MSYKTTQSSIHSNKTRRKTMPSSSSSSQTTPMIDEPRLSIADQFMTLTKPIERPNLDQPTLSIAERFTQSRPTTQHIFSPQIIPETQPSIQSEESTQHSNLTQIVKEEKKRIKKTTYDLESKGDQERGIWVGSCYVQRGCGRRGWVFFSFLSLIGLVIVIYLIWPRIPLMRIEGASSSLASSLTETRQTRVGNVAFESGWVVNVTVDNRQNLVPTRLVQVQVIVKDALTGMMIGKGGIEDEVMLRAREISTLGLNVRVDYQARERTDTTMMDLTKACLPTDVREVLPLHFWITLHFFGLDWLGYRPTVIVTPATGGFACPQS